MRRSSWIGVGAVALGAAGGVPSCAGELSGDPSSYVALRSTSGRCDAVPVFARRCATSICHSGDNPTGALDLSPPGLESRLVGVASKSNGCESRKLIDPSDVEKSFLLEKVESSTPSCGQQMPLTGQLTSRELACIRSWVTDLVGGDGGDGGDAGGSGAGGSPGDASLPPPDATRRDSGATP